MSRVTEILPPWTGLGTPVDHTADPDTWRQDAGLGWEAARRPVSFDVPGAGLREFKGRDVIYRGDTNMPLSIVSSRYKIHQPSELVDFFSHVIDQTHGAFQMRTLGQLGDGRKIWALAESTGGDELVLTKGDEIKRYLLLATSMDQTLPTVIKQTSIRPVCYNTLVAAVQEKAGASQRVKHTTVFNPEQVAEGILLDDQWSAFCEVVERLAGKPLNGAQAEDFFLDVFYPEKVRKSKHFSERGADKKVGELMEIRSSAPGQLTKAAKGSAWGALNAVTFYLDHEARSRDASARLDKSWFGENEKIKARALELLSA